MIGRTGVTDGLAQFVTGTHLSIIPPDVASIARLALLNFFAAGLAGSREPASRILMATLATPEVSGPALVLGRGDRADIFSAAFLNAASSSVLDFDETHLPTVIHPVGAVASALLALSARHRIEGPTLLSAMVAGVEVTCRLGRLLTPDHYRRGWHITSTCGVIGAAAAAARALNCSREEVVAAIGNAATQSCGLVASLGSMSKSLAVANAARNGLMSALLAAEGFTGPDDPLEGRFGFLDLFGSGRGATSDADKARSNWEMREIQIKPYPCGVVINPAVECARQIAATDGFDADAVSSVSITGPQILVDRADRPHPATRGEARLSVQHAAAVALLFGAPALEHFGEAALADRRLEELRRKIDLRADPGRDAYSTRMEIVLHEGRVLHAETGSGGCTGQRQLSRSEAIAKFKALAAGIVPDKRLDELVASIDAIHESEDVSKVWGYLQ